MRLSVRDALRPGTTILAALLAAPAVGAQATQLCAADAAPIDAALSLVFAQRAGAETRVEGTFRVADASGEPTRYRIAGAALRGARRIDEFRVDLEPPAVEGPVRLGFVRMLPPGHYRLELELLELPSGRCLRTQHEIDVPAALGASPATTGVPVSLRILPPPPGLLVGKTRVEAETRGAGIDAVAFELDGKRVMTRARPPWTVELDLGGTPRLHRLTVLALDPAGAELARDDLELNAGPHCFGLRLALARSRDPGTVEARAIVEVPEGERLDRVEIDVNDRRRATLWSPPFVQPLPVSSAEHPTWVRAAAYLEGGGAVEEVRVLEETGSGEIVEVDFVELFATVTDRRARAVADLLPDEVEVREDGRLQVLRRFERVDRAPFHVVVALDASGSMSEELPEAERAALGFFQRVLTERDRAAVVTFAGAPRLASRFTSDAGRLAGGLAGLEAGGGTALYDSVAFALHYAGCIAGRRALVLLSDGDDSGSGIGFEALLDYARRTGVVIYTIGLAVPSKPERGVTPPGAVLDRLASETGGRSFRIDRAANLGPIYEEIENDLRAQYLLAYQSGAPASDGFRHVEIDVKRPGVRARTAAGYYP